MRRQRLSPDDVAAVQAFEAVLAAIIVLTALVFFALVQRPAAPEVTTGLDLEQSAADALALLRVGSGGANNLQADTLAALGGAPDAFKAHLIAALPTGVHWAVSLDNGFGRLRLDASDADVFAQPVNAQGATAYVAFSSTTVWSGADAGGVTNYLPGQTAPAHGTCTDLDSPATTGTGDVNGPPTSATSAKSWMQYLTEAGNTIPAGFPFGTWTFRNGAGCTNPSFDVVLGGSTATTPAYAVNLVVWTLG